MHSAKIKNGLLIALFILFIGYYGFLILFTKDNVSTESENREISKFPEISMANYENITSEFTVFLKDYIPYRNSINNYYNNIMVKLFDRPIQEGVILGKENWLFYDSHAKDADTDEVTDYNGSSIYTETQMEKIAAEVRAADECCKAHGAQLIFFIAPNKSSVYSQYMPDEYMKINETTRVDMLYDYLCENTDAIIMYPKEELRELSGTWKTYFSNDTHWNGLGGYFAADMMAEVFGLDYPGIEEVELVEETSPEDLKYMLGVEKYGLDTGNLIPDYGKIHQVNVIAANEHMVSYESDNKNGKQMLLLGDSFSEKLVPALGIAVERLDASRSRYYQFAESDEYDFVVYEFVERNLSIIAN